METEVIYVTAEGKKKLEKQLEQLLARKAAVAGDIGVAREFGDLSENAEYDAARGAQQNHENEIKLVREQLQHIKVFSYAKANTSCVNIGTRVKIEDMSSKKTQEWIITGSIENDPVNFYVSNEAPLGKALLGKKVGEIVEYSSHVGKFKYKIVKISPGA